MNEYQISKYNPKYRVNGVYIRNECSGESDIGKVFEDGTLTRQAYEAILTRYVNCTIDLLKRAKVEQMIISDIEIYDETVAWKEHEVIKLHQLNLVIDDCLHEKCWCRLAGIDVFIHFGYELYLYVGCEIEYDEIVSVCEQYGLFVIEKESPYKELV